MPVAVVKERRQKGHAKFEPLWVLEFRCYTNLLISYQAYDKSVLFTICRLVAFWKPRSQVSHQWMRQ